MDDTNPDAAQATERDPEPEFHRTFAIDKRFKPKKSTTPETPLQRLERRVYVAFDLVYVAFWLAVGGESAKLILEEYKKFRISVTPTARMSKEYIAIFAKYTFIDQLNVKTVCAIVLFCLSVGFLSLFIFQLRTRRDRAVQGAQLQELLRRTSKD